jgi:drug/metabolite transporter (DMT)-like permease
LVVCTITTNDGFADRHRATVVPPQNRPVTPPSGRRPSTAAIALALLIVYVVWGSTYLGIAVMIETLPPLLAAGSRYLIAGGVMIAAVTIHARLRGRRDEVRTTRVQWRAAFIVGTLLLLGGNGGVVLAELLIPSGVAAVLVATVPIWFAVFDAILERRPPTRLVVGGLVAGIVGVAVLLAPVEGIGRIDPLGVVLVVGGTMCWAAGSLYARRAPLPSSGLLTTGMEMAAGGFSLVLGGILLGEIARTDVAGFSDRSLFAFGYLVVFGSIVAFSAYGWLLANVSVSTVATYAYVNPLVAVVLGAVILQEELTLRTAIAGVLILGAVIAMVSGRPRNVEQPRSDAASPRSPVAERGTDHATDASS